MKIMVNDEVVNYIKNNLQKGRSKEIIKTVLIKAGWKIEDIEEAFIRVGAVLNDINTNNQNNT